MKLPQITKMLQEQPCYALTNRRDAHELSDPHGLLVAFRFGFWLKTRWYARWAARKLVGKVLDNEHCLPDAG